MVWLAFRCDNNVGLYFLRVSSYNSGNEQNADGIHCAGEGGGGGGGSSIPVIVDFLENYRVK